MIRLTCNSPALRVLVVGSLVIAGACRDDSIPSSPSVVPESPGLQQALQGNSPDPLVAYGRAIPGFGGLFLDQSGVPTVYLTDVRQRPAAERALAGELRMLGVAPSQLRVLRGEYDYLQLDGWFNQAAPQALAVPGVVFVDVDEGSNRLRIGVEHAAADAAVQGTIARLNVPGAAVVVERTEPIHFATTLQQFVTPKRGGIQISSAKGICSLGFNSWPQGVITHKAFITASHCTNTQGVVEGTQFYQPTVSSSYLIGTEVADPAFFTSFPCPSGRKCRFSDAARIKYVTGPGVDFGGIARTTGQGSITIDPANPVFNITAEKSAPVLFSVVHKIGRTTGWTTGVVINTCAGVNVTKTNITLFCQDRVKAKSWFGDSGSPVFSWSGSGSNVTLNGIYWGLNSSGTEFLFSRMSGIEGELGGLTTY